MLQLLAMVAAKLGVEGEGVLAETDVVVARKSFDARTKKVKGAKSNRIRIIRWSRRRVCRCWRSGLQLLACFWFSLPELRHISLDTYHTMPACQSQMPVFVFKRRP